MKKTEHPPVRKRDVQWLKDIQRGDPGMYPGMRQRDLPESVAHRLVNRGGLIIPWYPHNSIHADRWVVTEAGKRVLQERAASTTEET